MIRDWSHTGTFNWTVCSDTGTQSRSQQVGSPDPELWSLGTTHSLANQQLWLWLKHAFCLWMKHSYSLISSFPSAEGDLWPQLQPQVSDLWPLDTRSRSSPHSFRGTAPLCPAADRTTNRTDLRAQTETEAEEESDWVRLVYYKLSNFMILSLIWTEIKSVWLMVDAVQ